MAKTKTAPIGKIFDQMSDLQREGLAREYFPLWAAELAVAPQTREKIELEKRPWLWDLYGCESREIVVRKGNQVGVTLWALLRMLHATAFRWKQGGLYFLPKMSHVADFVRQKVDPILKCCPSLKARDGETADNMGFKMVGDSPIMFRGMESEAGRQTVSADGICLDERDIMDPDHIEDALKRLAGSENQERLDISRPSVPGFGIDARFALSDQRFWTMKCSACSKEWTFEESWPNCVKGRPGTRFIACPACGDAADAREGKWIARNQASMIAGFQVSGLLNPYFKLETEFELWENNPAMFTRAILGLPFLERDRGISADTILSVCDGGHVQMEKHPGPTKAGADVGNEGHVVVSEKTADGKIRIVHLKRWKEWADLDRIMSLFHVGTMLVDAMPEKRAARDFCARWPGRAYMVFYDANRKGSPKWDDSERIVHMDRTETLDASFSPLYTGNVLIPRRDDPESRIFAQHAQNLIRIVEDLPNGDKIAKWNNIGPDHYRHAWNYDFAAWQRVEYETVVS